MEAPSAYCQRLLGLPLSDVLSTLILACNRWERTPRRQRLCIPLNALLQVICNCLHRRYIHLVSFLGLDGFLGLFGTKGLAQGSAGFKALQGGDCCGLERLESLDLVCQDMEGCLANRRHLSAFVMHRNKIPGRKHARLGETKIQQDHL